MEIFYKSNSFLDSKYFSEIGDNETGIAVAFKNIGNTDSFYIHIFNAAKIYETHKRLFVKHKAR